MLQRRSMDTKQLPVGYIRATALKDWIWCIRVHNNPITLLALVYKTTSVELVIQPQEHKE